MITLFLFEIYDHVTNCDFRPLSNCLNLQIWSIRREIEWTKLASGPRFRPIYEGFQKFTNMTPLPNSYLAVRPKDDVLQYQNHVVKNLYQQNFPKPTIYQLIVNRLRLSEFKFVKSDRFLWFFNLPEEDRY